MNRSRLIDRIYLRREGEERRITAVAPTSTERGLELATVLATMCPADLLEALVSHVSALNEFGGEVYISSARERFDRDGFAVGHSEPGEYQTLAYIVNYNHRARIRGQVQEPDSPLTEAEPPEAELAIEPEPEPVPEPIEA